MVPMSDAYAPVEVAERVRDGGIRTATAPAATLVALAVLAGAFIALGALFFMVTITAGPNQDGHFGLTRLTGKLLRSESDILRAVESVIVRESRWCRCNGVIMWMMEDV